MTRTDLIDKKTYYEKLKVTLSEKDFSQEIEEEVTEYRKKVEERYEIDRANDLKKVDHYLELLDNLIEEATKDEVLSAQSANTNQYY